MSKTVRPSGKPHNWRRLSKYEVVSFHTVLDDYSPNMTFGDLVLIDNKEKKFCILRATIKNLEHLSLPLDLIQKHPEISLILEGLKTAY